MVAHVVLFDLRPDLSAAERDRFVAAFRGALDSIPAVRRHTVGRRRSIGAGYEAQMPAGFSFFAVIEFDDEDGLRAYLEHPAHAGLGTLFWSCSTRTLVLDYELAGSDLGRAFADWESGG